MVARVMRYRSTKQQEKTIDRQFKPAVSEKSNSKRLLSETSSVKSRLSKIEIALQDDATTQQVAEATYAMGDKNDRFYVRDFASLLSRAKKQGWETVKSVFVKIIDAKIDELKTQIKQDDVPRPRVLGIFTPNESFKRRAKIRGLERLKIRVNYDAVTVSAIKNIVDDNPGIFQSFMKDKSDVKLIFEAAKTFLITKKTPKFIWSDSSGTVNRGSGISR